MKKVRVGCLPLVVLAMIAVTVACHSDGDESVVARRPVAEPTDVPDTGALSDFARSLPGTLPDIAVDGTVVVAYQGRDFSDGVKDAALAVSQDGGQSFRRLHLGGGVTALWSPSVSIVDRTVIVVGSRCTDPGPPDPGNVEGDVAPCGNPIGPGSVSELEAYRIDLDHDHVEKLPSPPTTGSVMRSLGTVQGRAAIAVVSPTGPKVLTWNDGWRARDLPSNTSNACGTRDQIIAVWNTSHDQDDPGSPPVTQGTGLWAASVSPDLGQTWSKPTVFASQAGRDVETEPWVDCGPAGLIALSGQVAAFSYEHRRWTSVHLPPSLAPGLPGAPVAWIDDDAARLWTGPVRAIATQPQLGPGYTQEVVMTHLFDDAPHVTVGNPVDMNGSNVLSTFGPGGSANGYVILRLNDSFRLGRAATD